MKVIILYFRIKGSLYHLWQWWWWQGEPWSGHTNHPQCCHQPNKWRTKRYVGRP